MSIANPLWGAPRIHGELLKLGIDIGQTSVAKYMVGRDHSLPPGPGRAAPPICSDLIYDRHRLADMVSRADNFRFSGSGFPKWELPLFLTQS
jgi:hypothetical protein